MNEEAKRRKPLESRLPPEEQAEVEAKLNDLCKKFKLPERSFDAKNYRTQMENPFALALLASAASFGGVSLAGVIRVAAAVCGGVYQKGTSAWLHRRYEKAGHSIPQPELERVFRQGLTDALKTLASRAKNTDMAIDEAVKELSTIAFDLVRKPEMRAVSKRGAPRGGPDEKELEREEKLLGIPSIIAQTVHELKAELRNNPATCEAIYNYIRIGVWDWDSLAAETKVSRELWMGVASAVPYKETDAKKALEKFLYFNS